MSALGANRTRREDENDAIDPMQTFGFALTMFVQLANIWEYSSG